MSYIPSDARYVCELIRDTLGTDYEYRWEQLERKLAQRYSQVGCRDLRDYRLILENTAQRGNELKLLASLLGNPQTHFFREAWQIDVFAGPLFDELLSRADRQNPVRIWSAGCASGEEPYTLAIALHQRGLLQNTALEIIGTDISSEAIELARIGIYGSQALRGVEPGLIDRYFVYEENGFAVIPEIKKHVRFDQNNLLDEAAVLALGHFDVIFCRNVLVSFNRSTQTAVGRSLTKVLQKNGYLLLGHADALARDILTSFTMRSFRNTLVLQHTCRRELPSLPMQSDARGEK